MFVQEHVARFWHFYNSVSKGSLKATTHDCVSRMLECMRYFDVLSDAFARVVEGILFV